MEDHTHESLSITEWLDQARVGDSTGYQQLWLRYYERLVRLARARLSARDRRVSDEEDLATMALAALFRALETGKLPEIQDRESLWRVLVTITDNKILDHVKYQKRQRRGDGKVRGHSAFLDAQGEGYGDPPDPTPQFAHEFGVVCEDLLDSLREDLQRIAIWKMEGHTNREIAEKLGCVEESVRRKILLIRSQWSS